MKGVILAGGSGSRLYPLTKVTNKHLLPVWDKPMIFYPLRTLINAAIKDIMIISGPEYAGHFLRLLGSGKDFGIKLTYEIQDKAMGIANALSLAEDFFDQQKCTAILGDNIFEDNIIDDVENFKKRDDGAHVFLKKVSNPERFGVPRLDKDKVEYIEEKPKNPKSSYAVTGLYMYDRKVFDIIKNLKKSDRGEYEITDVSNAYIKNNELTYSVLKGFWSDAGTFESLYAASNHVMKNEDKYNISIK